MSKKRWLFFPDYRSSNPYQELLARVLAAEFDVVPGTVTDALDVASIPGTVFQLHWEEAVFAGLAAQADAEAAIGLFLAELDAFRLCGGLVVWTVHNAAPHENRFPDLATDFRRALAIRADLVHVHGETAATLLHETGASPDKVLVMRHPNFRAAYPDDIDDAAARRYFGFSPEHTVFAFLGAMRAYKGIETLTLAFAEAHRAQPSARLILAGRPAGADVASAARLPGTVVLPRFIEDCAVQYILRAADTVVFPYRSILTAGSLMLALGFSRPVIVPALPALLDVVSPGRDALLFEPGNARDLARALLDACAQNQQQRAQMRLHARLTAGASTFEQMGRALLGWVRDETRSSQFGVGVAAL